MWFCFNDAFVSVVQSDEPGLLMVRARSYQHLRNVFPNTLLAPTGKPYTILTTKHNDYRYRVFCTKASWEKIVSQRINDIDYTNFKDSVKEEKLHKMYEEFWFLHMIYQNGKKWWKKQAGWLNYRDADLVSRNDQPDANADVLRELDRAIKNEPELHLDPDHTDEHGRLKPLFSWENKRFKGYKG